MTRQERITGNKWRRMREAVARETPNERRERLLMLLDVAKSNPRWAPQADALRAELERKP